MEKIKRWTFFGTQGSWNLE